MTPLLIPGAHPAAPNPGGGTTGPAPIPDPAAEAATGPHDAKHGPAAGVAGSGSFHGFARGAAAFAAWLAQDPSAATPGNRGR